MARRCTIAILVALSGCQPPSPDAGHAQPAGPMKPALVRPFAMGTPDAVLLVTGGTNGLLEVCNCAGPMPGGMARRSGLVHSYRAAFDHTFLIDLGNFCWVDPNDIRSDFLLRDYAHVGYDAVVLGAHEWGASPDRLVSLLASAPMPYLSSTVTQPGLKVQRAITVHRDGLKLAVVSDVRQEALRFVPRPRAERLTIAPPAELHRQIRQLKDDGHVVILAAQVDEEALPSLGESGADLILRGNTIRTDPKLARAGKIPAARVGGTDHVGVLALQVSDGRIAKLEYRVEPVDSTWPADRAPMEIYQAYAHAAMRRALDAERTEGLDYVPSETCAKCHKGEFAGWRRTRHAAAYSTLVKAKRTGDPNCLMCHTSGFGTRKGFYTIDKTPDLANVNCQDCHRTNLPEHRDEVLRKDRKPAEVNASACVACHTPLTSPGFDFNAKRTLIRASHKPAPNEGEGR